MGNVPLTHIMIIIDYTLQEEESDTTTKEGHEKRIDGTKTGGGDGTGWRKKKDLFSGRD